MTTVTDVTSAWPNRLMLTASAAAFLAGVVGFHWAGDRALMALGLLLAGLVVAVVLGLLSPSGRRFVAFSKEATHEAKRVHWPTRKETLQATGIVFVFVFVMALFLWLTDKSLEWVLYDLLLGWK
ncbi:MAG: preprotein translocase subunit SecE [Burkholderiaceae bacterium]